MSARTSAFVFIGAAAGAMAFQIALAAGAPWGAYAMGGAVPGRWPAPLRIVAFAQATMLGLMIAIVAACAGLALPRWSRAARRAIWAVVLFSAMALAANVVTPSAGERALWAPVAATMLVSSLVIALPGRLFLQATIAVLALPGVVAFAVPLLLIAPAHVANLRPIGWVVVGVGVIVLIATIREFYVAGRGTLAPWAPPRRLVVTGLYRISRNPMYVGVVLILAGWAIGFRSWPLVVYTTVMTAIFHVRILLHEEPFLARTHGEAWRAYRARVPRWFRSV
jgi:protein-S-isoprenylcysteine O-methyltransferase Ste14